jgi:hypothetical protein
MKIIINESQLRLIVENEEKKGDNLLSLNPIFNSGISPDEWDEMFEFMNQKKGGIYDGYYINGNIDIRDSSVKEFKHLVRVNGHLKAYGSKIEDLGKLRRVNGNLTLSKTENLKSLGNLEYVGFSLDLIHSNIEDLGHLNEVGRSLDLRFTPKLKSLGEVSPSFTNDKFKIYVTNHLFTYNTGLSDDDIDKIKRGGTIKSMASDY